LREQEVVFVLGLFIMLTGAVVATWFVVVAIPHPARAELAAVAALAGGLQAWLTYPRARDDGEAAANPQRVG
jgi:hypothetical protein